MQNLKPPLYNTGYAPAIYFVFPFYVKLLCCVVYVHAWSAIKSVHISYHILPCSYYGNMLKYYIRHNAYASYILCILNDWCIVQFMPINLTSSSVLLKL